MSDRWESLEAAGLVRVRIEPDHDCNPGEWCETDADRAEQWRLIAVWGAWGFIAEARATVNDPWQHADSCWGFIFDGPIERDAYGREQIAYFRNEALDLLDQLSADAASVLAQRATYAGVPS